MRILVISHEYPSVGGGGGKVAQDLSHRFVHAGHQVRVITAHYGELARQESDQGVLLERVPSLRKKPFQASLAAMASFVIAGSFAALKQIRSWKPDLLHIHFAVPSGPIGWICKKLTGIPYVITIHLGDVPGGTPEKTDHWFKFIYPFTPPIWKSAAHVVAVSAFTRDLALQKYSVPIDVIHNGIQLAGHEPEIRTRAVPEIVFAGRFIDQKDPLQVVKILSQCADLDWHCSMFGDGILKSDVEAEIQRAGLSNRFSLPGWVTPREAEEHFQQSDILLMPSRSEGLPVVGVQALAAGLCLVVSRVGGFLELVDEGINGFLLPPGGGELWVQAVRELLARPEKLLEMRQASLQKVVQFDLEKIAQAYLEVFQEVIRNEEAELRE